MADNKWEPCDWPYSDAYAAEIKGKCFTTTEAGRRIYVYWNTQFDTWGFVIKGELGGLAATADLETAKAVAVKQTRIAMRM